MRKKNAANLLNGFIYYFKTYPDSMMNTLLIYEFFPVEKIHLAFMFVLVTKITL